MFNASATYVFAIILFILQATLLCVKFFIGMDNCSDTVLSRIAARLKSFAISSVLMDIFLIT